MADFPETVSFEEASRLLGVEPRRVKQLVRDRILFSVALADGSRGIPREIIVSGENGWEPHFALPGTLTLLSDDGFTPDEAAAWLYTFQEELAQTPMAAILSGRHHRVNAIASTLAF
ncbi:MAG: Rv2175c family DNA-binding protein [Schaalia hyovaginalis]|uniref:Rv2175c family DNA-binding protein n=1 Tax=Schaalia TaxID=2529408 RepID=UPI0012B3A608|nr:Rv2175c family DNA-binding protein [Schaalia hyovaginalis]MCF2711078.1 transcriptional regulator [Schaalia hyovaginalis]MCI6412033.1 Rv2175c family DNA-binding protein [Schaalia hyovaginalis]MCI6556795.1 Rv2175c family DNA-binding protein [Schaalia hyovaginalis]MCI7513138.1 Rv2175c family DNA-binding protein [Schaalia hyovaginalis]MCI7672487.1 Rv2175c family DNA-binding protein [Schaalia hyovaginalis]